MADSTAEKLLDSVQLWPRDGLGLLSFPGADTPSNSLEVAYSVTICVNAHAVQLASELYP